MKNINDPMGLLESILETIDQHAAGPELKDAKELENEATEEKAPVELASDVDNKDVYPADEHEEKSEVEDVVVESEQVAAGPELKDAEELKNEATENKAEPEAEELENDDVYASDEHKEAEEVEDVVVESEQVAAGPELGSGKELENEATEDKEPVELASGVDNKDVYPADEHEECEDAEPVIIKETSLKKFANDSAKAIRKSEVRTAKAQEKIDKADANGDKEKIKAAKDAKIQAVAAAKAKEDVNKVASVKDANGVKQIVSHKDAASFIDKVNKDRLNQGAEKEKTEKKVQATKDSISQHNLETEKKTQDIRNANTIKKEEAKAQRKEAARNAHTLRGKIRARLGLAEDTEISDLDLMRFLEAEEMEVSANAVINLREELQLSEDELETNPVVKDAEDAGVASDEKAEDGIAEVEELEREDEEKEDELEKNEESDKATAEEDAADEDKETEDMNESMNAIFALLDRINESVQTAAGPELEGAKELENEATDENKAEPEAKDVDNKDVFPAEEHKEAEEVEEVVVESEQVAAGPELKNAKELENEATEEKAPEVAEPEADNKDVYCDVMHKQVEDVVDVVIEAANCCKKKGVKATKENIVKEAKSLLEADEVAVEIGKPAEKEFDVDASIESAEMNGNDEKFECYDEIQGEGSEAAKADEAEVKPSDIQESVAYKSLREACVLDEDYFMVDSYVKETAEAKQTKLTEQVSLLLARDAEDPMYEELLRESVNCIRLQEALVKKYSADATERAKLIINK